MACETAVKDGEGIRQDLCLTQGRITCRFSCFSICLKAALDAGLHLPCSPMSTIDAVTLLPHFQVLPQTYRIHKILCFINQQLQLLSSLCHKVWRKRQKPKSVGRIPVQKAASNTQAQMQARSSWQWLIRYQVVLSFSEIARQQYLRNSLTSHSYGDFLGLT